MKTRHTMIAFSSFGSLLTEKRYINFYENRLCCWTYIGNMFLIVPNCAIPITLLHIPQIGWKGNMFGHGIWPRVHLLAHRCKSTRPVLCVMLAPATPQIAYKLIVVFETLYVCVVCVWRVCTAIFFLLFVSPYGFGPDWPNQYIHRALCSRMWKVLFISIQYTIFPNPIRVSNRQKFIKSFALINITVNA